MAESKGVLLAKSVQKHAGRAKEKILQNLGKVDRTADDIFDEHLTNFNRQQTNANRLQKEFNNYIRCIRAVQTASKTLMDAICDVYENQWAGSEALRAQVAAIEVLWQDFSHKLGDQVLIPLNTYTAQFPEMKKKIEKRNRKLIDYDSQRHSFQNLQANAAKRKDDVKVTKGREQLEEARRTYELLNSELHDELPALHDSRILFLVTNLQTLFASEQVFHNETNKIYAELEAIVDKLATDSQRGSYTLKKAVVNSTPSSPQQPTIKGMVNSTPAISNNSYPNTTITNGSANANSPSSPASVGAEEVPADSHREARESPPSPTLSGKKAESAQGSAEEPSYQNTEAIRAAAATVIEDSEANALNANVASDAVAPASTEEKSGKTRSAAVTADAADAIETVNGNVEKVKEDAAAAASAADQTATDLPPGTLYRVKATYRYIKEDADELSFEVGDIIRVIEYDDPEDQEEGWLMGMKENSSEKGLFPANFTRPL
ncbi:myc box-dependent-interacting protein 1 isoform X1 [Phlebotomus argentipes]|uniref:myc box-dependent-interacting protein 1 isoform X1 n=1 Tax=Phlebotomus argentipes TaxID=94469 RepID=UPI0028935C70|nr:myc box-dependent-interacting protein 1 isoform X1 [Phlebotomus argentipes]